MSTPNARFSAALEELKLTLEIQSFPESTRTAGEAAAAIGCELAQIAKSLVFEADGQPVLVLMDGASRVDVDLVAKELRAAKVRRAGADVVREATGYAIGGVAPFGHRTRMTVLADRGLLRHDVVWAAAGTPYAVFAIDPARMIEAAGGRPVDVRELPADVRERLADGGE
ncbi:YbaK/EbsC family protein [Wenjunlia tyrosinilytica]|uniref:Aminoacyl-tRNA deacylase n=1 Tax=Wenjunlia tyrosinilytica TaxID=1544741 RepID=A0A917ZQ55_9ACTN|nr:YbaK/EbsC family protein [Wenjunlia tyrosinilytica]GGO88449.1 aminoacyl-tRNA deacylase [Wenjunlia tyrosinilytica]